MSAAWVVLTYGASVILALLLLYFFHARSWYWHVLSAGVAVTLGLIPMPARYAGPSSDLFIGFLFLLLLVWGVAAPLFRFLEVGRHS
jgi:hypothetical protein